MKWAAEFSSCVRRERVSLWNSDLVVVQALHHRFTSRSEYVGRKFPNRKKQYTYHANFQSRVLHILRN